MTVERGGLAQSVQVRLVRHAKEIGADPNLVLTRYGVERFFYRLSRSRHAERFVLKGALLLLVWLGENLRPTRDADLLGFGDLSDGELLAIFREVCEVAVEPDAVTFDGGSVKLEPIREADAYGGRRIVLQSRIGPARLSIQVDVGIGDAITPAPQWLEYPSLLGFPSARLKAYPRETVVAEKLHAMVLFGARNSRMKDYFDVHALLREGKLDQSLISRAIAATFDRRRTALPQELPVGLSETFSADPQHQARWQGFLAKNHLQGPTLPEIVTEMREPLVAAIERARKPGAHPHT
jgi:predicted nucleotidyltransferase component of viral defense system